jgi:hypothetical protein
MKRVLAAAALIAVVGGAAATGAAATVSAGSAEGSGRPLSTTLTPGAEVAPFVGKVGASGSVSLRFNPGQGTVCVDLETTNFNLKLAHIHKAPAGQNGGVVVDFTKLIDGSGVDGCVAADRDLIREIIRDPQNFYVNLHEGVPPGPAFFSSIRGQLGR